VTKSIFALALGFALAGGALAQIATGSVYGVARDESGAMLPGVVVTLKGDLGTRSTVSGPDGAFRFLGLDRGDYTLTLALSSFATVVRRVRVATGENLDLTFAMRVSGVAETVEVTGESPLVDTKKRGTATTMTSEELNDIPSARDPWGVMKSVPGVLVDRVNIAGNYNGQQASYSSKGATRGDSTWNLDGVNITDMSDTGASPTYFDFGAFQEISMTTGGTDMTMQAGGLGINLVTRRGTNAFHGGARYLLASHKMSFGNISGQNQAPYSPANLAQDPRLLNPDGSFRDQGDHIEQIGEYGFDLGGPIIKDKLWFHGGYGKQDIRIERLVGTRDKTLLRGYNAKVNWQATTRTMVSAYWFQGEKLKFGRSPGSGLQEEDGVLWNQKNFYTDGGLPGGFWKLQVDQTFSPSFFVSGKFAYYDTGFGFTPRGTGTDATYDNVDGIYRGTGTGSLSIRPQKSVNLDASRFFQGLGGTNELKFGFGYRDVSARSGATYAGQQIVGIINTPEYDPRTTDCTTCVQLYRDSDFRYGGKYVSAYVGDMLSLRRFTLNAGVRWDHQSSTNGFSTAKANGAFPGLMPALTVEWSRSDNVYDWDDLSPRVGLSYAFDEGRKTVARASYARYYEQLNLGSAALINPVNGYSSLAYGWDDTNHDGFAQKNEIDLANFLYSYAIDPANPGNAESSVNRIDKNVKPKDDDELIVALDHEIAAGFGVGAAFTYRIAGNWRTTYRLAEVCSGALVDLSSCAIIPSSAYTKNPPQTVTVGGETYTGYTYSPPEDLVDAGIGVLDTNRVNYKTHYKGLELTLNKRLANKWMARVAFTYADWTLTYPGARIVDGHAVPQYGNPTPRDDESWVDGDLVGRGGSGRRDSFYTTFKWQVYANALYQLPWRVDISGAAWGRQGGVAPPYLLIGAGRDGTLNALGVPTLDTHRDGNVWDFDLRLAKTFKLGKQPYLTLAAEWFNIANSGAVLSHNRQVDSDAFSRVDEVLHPSIFRVSATCGF
jgi:carboxypeptidase family protein/TonB-dependent receptor-like protein